MWCRLLIAVMLLPSKDLAFGARVVRDDITAEPSRSTAASMANASQSVTATCPENLPELPYFDRGIARQCRTSQFGTLFVGCVSASGLERKHFYRSNRPLCRVEMVSKTQTRNSNGGKKLARVGKVFETAVSYGESPRWRKAFHYQFACVEASKEMRESMLQVQIKDRSPFFGTKTHLGYAYVDFARFDDFEEGSFHEYPLGANRAPGASTRTTTAQGSVKIALKWCPFGDEDCLREAREGSGLELAGTDWNDCNDGCHNALVEKLRPIYSRARSLMATAVKEGRDKEKFNDVENKFEMEARRLNSWLEDHPIADYWKDWTRPGPPPCPARPSLLQSGGPEDSLATPAEASASSANGKVLARVQAQAQKLAQRLARARARARALALAEEPTKLAQAQAQVQKLAQKLRRVRARARALARAEPAEPTETPVTPDEPTESTEPTEPTEPPVTIVEPTEPPETMVEPAEPPVIIVEPTEPPVTIVEPTEPPETVVEPTEPPVIIVEPTEPPVTIVEPTEPPETVVEPTEPPVIIVEPTEPPVTPAAPTQPPVTPALATPAPCPGPPPLTSEQRFALLWQAKRRERDQREAKHAEFRKREAEARRAASRAFAAGKEAMDTIGGQLAQGARQACGELAVPFVWDAGSQITKMPKGRFSIGKAEEAMRQLDAVWRSIAEFKDCLISEWKRGHLMPSREVETLDRKCFAAISQRQWSSGR